MTSADPVENFISAWCVTGGSELADTQSFVNGLSRKPLISKTG
jgi:hypothetical protein